MTRHGTYQPKIQGELLCLTCGNAFTPKRSDARFCNDCRESRKTEQRAVNGIQQFRAVDGEGIGRGSDHKYVLLGIGDYQQEWPNGVESITDIFSCLYGQFLLGPGRIFCGFYLTYDWNMWLRLLPRERVWRLLAEDGIRSRFRRSSPVPFPVRYQGWEFDMLWGKRFKLRPEGSSEWLYLNDVGPFFQTSLLKALHTRSERVDITDEEVALIAEGKSKRASAELDDDMRLYNRLENKALESLMEDLARGFRQLGVKLGKTEFHGPGQAAQKWAEKQAGIMLSNARVLDLPQDILDALIASYYGGIFEITAHGHIPGMSYEYDINSAYPYAMVRLPCMCGDWEWDTEGEITLYDCTVIGADPILGPVPFRTKQRRIRRPTGARGWYWKHEIDAATKAGLVSKLVIHRQLGYLKKCNHENPVKDLANLYQTRLNLGKESALGKAMKLIYNSLYGKFAQSIGTPKVANVVFASLITSFCRVQILEAIASHPMTTKALLMIATDAVFFKEPHPTLSLSDRLGDWEETKKENLTIFKPGMYWDDKARLAIEAGDDPVFKSRGVSASDFKEWIADIDAMFLQWNSSGPPYYRPAEPADHTKRNVVPEGWPTVHFPMGFNQISVKAALRWTEKMENPAAKVAKYQGLAGLVKESVVVGQTSDPSEKRNFIHMLEDYREHGDGIWRSRPWKMDPFNHESTPYDKRFGTPEEPKLFEEENGGIDEPLDIVYFGALGLQQPTDHGN